MQVAFAIDDAATVVDMNSDEIQAFRKKRLRELIAEHFGGKNIALARLLKNKDGEPLKDGAYIGHMLAPIGAKHCRPIDEARVREIEALRNDFIGWFTLPSIPKRGAVLHGTMMVPSHSSIRTPHEYGEPLDTPTIGALPNPDDGITPTGRAPVVVWARLGVELYKDREEMGPGESMPLVRAASDRAKYVIVDADHPRFRIRRGWAILLEPVYSPADCRDNDLYVFRTEGGTFVLAEFRHMTGGDYEAIPDSGTPLEHKKHGATVVAKWIATHSV